MAVNVGNLPGPPGLRVVVVGGGLAGIAAATALHSAGAAVTLLEARRALGGRASSFEDRDGDAGGDAAGGATAAATAGAPLLDNCQHVLLGCCTNLLDLYRRLGVADRITFTPAVRFVNESGKSFLLRATPLLPAPLHLGPSMATFGLLTLAQRAALARGMSAMVRLGPNGLEALEAVSFCEGLYAHGQVAELVRKLYDPVLVSALNEETRRVSSKYAISVFITAMLVNRGGYMMGVPNCPLEQLYGAAATGQTRLNTRMAGLEFRDGKVVGVRLQNGAALPADAVILATNFHNVSKQIPAELAARDRRFHALGGLESVPILGVHLWFDRPVMPYAHAALVRGPLQWLFRKDAAGRQVHGVISAARQWISVNRDDALRQFHAQIKEVLPSARAAALQRGVIVVEKRATFSPLPGAQQFRPAQAPDENGISNLFLAGDYTQTAWPSTMEGAVRSGYLAAEAVLKGMGAGAQKFIVKDLPSEWPARLLRR